MVGIQGTIYDPVEMAKVAEDEIIYIGTNLIGLVTRNKFFEEIEKIINSSKPKTVSIILALPEVVMLTAVKEALGNLLETATLINNFKENLPNNSQRRLKVFFHEAASSLSMTIIDPNRRNGILVFNPKFSNDASPANRIYCIIEKRDHKDIFVNLYGQVTQMQATNRMRMQEVLTQLNELITPR